MTNNQLARFLPKVETNTDGCWLWTAYRHSIGYGQFMVSFRPHVVGLSHRLAYEHFIGPIPEGMQIDHLCRVRACCNPLHLEPVTSKINIRRGLRCKESAVWNGTPQQHRDRIGRASKGHVVTPEMRARISAANSVNQLGRKHTPETKAKMAAARSAYWQRKREAA